MPPNEMNVEPSMMHLQRLISSISALVFELSPGGEILFVNEAVHALTGYTPAEIIGRNFWEVFFSGERNSQVQELQEKIRCCDVSDLELKLTTREGSPVVLSLTTANEWAQEEGETQSRLERIVGFAMDVTNRKLAEDQLRRNEQELDHAQQLARLGSWTWDLHTNTIRFSKELYRIYGLQTFDRELTYEHLLEFVHSEDRKLLQSELEQALDTRTSFSLDHRINQPNGKECILHVRGEVILDHNGWPVLMYGTGQDITERKLAEQALGTARDSVLRLLDQMPSLIWRSGTDGLCDYFNQNWLEFTGQPLEHELGNGWSEGIHPEDRERVIQIYQEHFTARQLFNTEYRLRDHRGDYRWILNMGRPFYDLEGDFAGYIGACYDVTERRRAEEALRESEERYRLMVDVVRDYAIFTLDPQGHITTWNAGAQAIKGYSAEEIIGQSFSRFYPPEVYEPGFSQIALERAAREGRFEDEGWRVRKDGTRFWASIVISPVRDKQGRLLGFTKVVRDITRRKKDEEELRRQTGFVKLLQDVAVAANEASSVEVALEYALRRICTHTGWKLGHAYLLEEEDFQDLSPTGIWHMAEKGRFEFFISASDELRFSAGYGMPGQVLNGDGPQWVDNIDSRPDFIRAEISQAVGIKTGMAFPLLVGRRVAGVLEFFTDEVVPRDDALVEVMSHIGAQLGRVVERQHGEIALRESEARFRTIFKGAPLGIEMVDLDGRLLEANPAVNEMLGYNIEELGDVAQVNVNHPANFVANMSQIQELRRGARDAYQVERPFRRNDGRWIWGRLSVALVRDQHERPQYAIGMLEDITDRKQMEADLAELQRRLMEGREAERLHLAQDLHDGPMQDLYGLSFNLKAFAQGLPADFNQNDLNDIQSSFHQIVRTLRHICGELRPPTLAPFGLEKAIQSHAEAFQEANPELSLVLNLASDGQSLPSTVRLALYRIYQQALDNVVRHSQANQIQVHLKLEDENVILEVQDNGTGFDPPDRWIDLARQGLLGLVNASERAEAIGGKLEVESGPGRGTLVKVTVPRTGEPKFVMQRKLLSSKE